MPIPKAHDCCSDSAVAPAFGRPEDFCRVRFTAVPSSRTTAQNTLQVTGVESVSPDMVRKQLEAVLSDIRPDVVKTGMMANAHIIRAVASSLSAARRIPIVVDPVMLSKSGDALLDQDAAVTIREQLFPLADLITPNIPEAEVLTGRALKTANDFEQAARQLHNRGAGAVLLKGGHQPRLQAGSDSGPTK